MANRCSIYVTDILPTPDAPPPAGCTLVSEWPHRIPLVYKVLVCAHPAPLCLQTADGNTAIAGDYAGGIAALRAFLDRLPALPELDIQKRKALDFLTQAVARKAYLVLDGTEIFYMNETMADDFARLMAEVQNLEPLVEAALKSLPARAPEVPPPGLLRRLFSPPPPRADDPLYAAAMNLGLGSWTGWALPTGDATPGA